MIIRAESSNLLRDVLRQGHRVPVKLSSSSLIPLAYSGETLVVEGRNAEQLRLGELIVFESDEGFVAHRIIGKQKRQMQPWFQTAGQEARVPDGWIPDGVIVGRVVEIREGFQAAGRSVPGKWRGRLWAWKIRTRCHLHCLRMRFNR